MLHEPTLEKLQSMRLNAMLQAWQEQNRSPDIHELSFEERFAMLVDAEHLHRENRRLDRLLSGAKLRLSQASLQDVQTGAGQGFTKAQRAHLATCRWIDEHLGVLITGPTGVGKTFLACALGHAACRKGYRTLYRRMPRLLEELTLARADGSYTRYLTKIAKAQLLIIDDWGLTPLKEAHRRDLLEILEDRYQLASTVVTSQLPLSKWHGYLGEPTIADAILDRLVHNAYKYNLQGGSRRKENAPKP